MMKRAVSATVFKNWRLRHIVLRTGPSPYDTSMTMAKIEWYKGGEDAPLEHRGSLTLDALTVVTFAPPSLVIVKNEWGELRMRSASDHSSAPSAEEWYQAIGACVDLLKAGASGATVFSEEIAEIRKLREARIPALQPQKQEGPGSEWPPVAGDELNQTDAQADRRPDSLGDLTAGSGPIAESLPVRERPTSFGHARAREEWAAWWPYAAACASLAAKADAEASGEGLPPMLRLGHDALELLAFALADPCHPHLAIGLGATCRSLRGPTLAPLEWLRERAREAEGLAGCLKQYYEDGPYGPGNYTVTPKQFAAKGPHLDLGNAGL